MCSQGRPARSLGDRSGGSRAGYGSSARDPSAPKFASSARRSIRRLRARRVNFEVRIVGSAVDLPAPRSPPGSFVPPSESPAQQSVRSHRQATRRRGNPHAECAPLRAGCVGRGTAPRSAGQGIFSAPPAFHSEGTGAGGGGSHTRQPGASAMNASTARTGAVQAASLREVRLRAEFADEYPEIQADIWMRSRELAERLVDRSHARRRQGLFTRTFDPRHFQFRGGELHAPRSARGR